jgi:CDP-glucose 4,6-dehydratase
MAMNGGFWLDRPVFVTGAAGFLGSWLTQRLQDHGADVVCLLRDWVPQSELVRSHVLEKVKVVRGDVRDAELLERILAEYEVSTVFHLAAQTTVGIANRSPISTFESNIRGTWNVLEACRRSPLVQSIVVASSDKAYGSHDELPYSEEAPLCAEHPYDVSKSCADLIARTYAKTYRLPVAVTRCGNLYGGGDLNWNRIVPGTIRSIVRGQRPVIRSDGQLIRDYFYVEDAVAAYMLLAEALACHSALAGSAFNFSNETATSVLDLVQKIMCQMGSALTPDIHNNATNEIRAQYLSAERARRILHWAPHFSLDHGLTRTISWYKEFLVQ